MFSINLMLMSEFYDAFHLAQPYLESIFLALLSRALEYQIISKSK